jgi:hypothetical protein
VFTVAEKWSTVGDRNVLTDHTHDNVCDVSYEQYMKLNTNEFDHKSLKLAAPFSKVSLAILNVNYQYRGGTFTIDGQCSGRIAGLTELAV